MQSANPNFLQRTTRSFYRHVPLLSFNERTRFLAALAQVAPPAPVAKAIVLTTQVQMQDKYRKRGWKLIDNLSHPFSDKHAKVYVKDGTVTVIYPDASVSRHDKVQVTYERGWHSPAEADKARIKANKKLPPNQQVLSAAEMASVRSKLLKSFQRLGK